MTITTSHLLSYARSIDSRINALNDAALLPVIQYASHNLSAQLTPFYKTEIIPFIDYYDAMVYNFDITPSEPVIDFYEVKIIETANGEDSMYSNVKVERTNDKTFSISITEGDVVGRNQSLKMSYFYYLTPVVGGTYEIDAEIWKMFIDCLNIQVWNHLKDYDKEKHHEAQLVKHMASKRLQMPWIMSSPEKMKGGFI